MMNEYIEETIRRMDAGLYKFGDVIFEYEGIPIICYIGKNTFYIYLIHFLVIKKLDSLGFGKWLLLKSGNAAVGEVVYTLCYIIVVFGISLIISSMIEMVKYIIRNRKSKKLEVE